MQIDRCNHNLIISAHGRLYKNMQFIVNIYKIPISLFINLLSIYINFVKRNTHVQRIFKKNTQSFYFNYFETIFASFQYPWLFSFAIFYIYMYKWWKMNSFYLSLLKNRHVFCLIYSFCSEKIEKLLSEVRRLLWFIFV